MWEIVIKTKFILYRAL